MPPRLPKEWNSLSELLFALRREEFLAGRFETHLRDPETGESRGKAWMPPFLYRGEPVVYPSTAGGLWRAQSLLSGEEFEYLQDLVFYAARDLAQKSSDQLPLGEAIAFAQHYGFFTPLVDFSDSLYVSAHFAVGSHASGGGDGAPELGCFIRIDLRRAQEYLALLRPTMLGDRFARPALQHAWTIEPPAAVGDKEGERREDDYWRNLKSPFFLESGILEVFHWRRNAQEDRLFFNPFLDCPAEDPYVGWPVLLVNGFVNSAGPMSERLATLLLGRLPLYQMVCFSRDDQSETPGIPVTVPSQLYCVGVHPGRVWDGEYLYKQWTEAPAA